MDRNSVMTLQIRISLQKLSFGLKGQTKNVTFEFWTKSKFSLPAEGPGGSILYISISKTNGKPL